jgi:proline-specific peptidase
VANDGGIETAKRLSMIVVIASMKASALKMMPDNQPIAAPQHCGLPDPPETRSTSARPREGRMILSRRAAIGAFGAVAATGWSRAADATLPQPDPRLWAPPPNIPNREGFAVAANGQIFYRHFGGGGRLPLVVLHGGPAAGHRYMLPYAQIALDRPVIFYDQSGCGRSAAPPELKRYTVTRYVAELEALRAHLGLDRMLLLGHSWGGFLAPAYAAHFPDRVAGLVLAGSAARWHDFAIAAERWLGELGPQAVATVRKAERSGKTEDPAYQALLERYYALHLCRLAHWPNFLDETGAAIGRNPVYQYLNGPSEFQFTGALARYDGSPAARSIRVPTLITCGEYDEAPPPIARSLAALIPGSRVEAFAGLSHMSHIEDPARVMGVTRRFLDRIG